MKIIVAINNLSYYYFEDEWVLTDIQLSVSEEEILGIAGASGCGKTTLVKLMAGLLQPLEGEVIRADGVTPVVMFQDALCLPWYRVLKNVTLAARVSKEKAKEILANLGLGGALNKYPYQLSGGMRTRLAAAMAIASDANVLMFDEPFDGLDEENKQNLQWLFNGLRDEGKSVVVVAHDILHLVQVCDRITVIQKGNGCQIVDCAAEREKIGVEALHDKVFELAKVNKDNLSDKKTWVSGLHS